MLVGTGLMGSHGERGVEQQHPLVGPACEIARGGGYLRAEVIVDFFDDVDQRGRYGNSLRYGETEAMGLPRLVVGVLTEDDHFHLVEGSVVESGEDVGAFGVADVSLPLFNKKRLQFGKIGGVELRL